MPGDDTMKHNVPLDGQNQNKQNLEEILRQKQADLTQQYTQLGKSLIELVEKENKAINSLVEEIVAIKTKIARGKVAKAKSSPLPNKEEP